jgi:putative DNA methylase
VHKRKLIEVALPLDAINREAERDTPKRSNHPWRMHFWWARRKLATARAVLFAQLVDDPSSDPDRFPTVEDQRAERDRLHGLIERLVSWDNARDPRLLAEVRAEIRRSSGGSLPVIFDPFAGGGSIPLEAQRLGLEARASDLNPVAVLINKALIEIPTAFADDAPIYPELAGSQIRDWKGAQGLAADVRAYGAWIRERALDRHGNIYPHEGGKSPIGWLWARTVRCPNPACGIDMPLVKAWWVAKKTGRKVFVVPTVVGDPTHPSGMRVAYTVSDRPGEAPTDVDEGTVGRRGAKCVSCGTAVPLSYIREEGRAKRLGQELLATIVDGGRKRDYIAPTAAQVAGADVDRPVGSIEGEIGFYPRDLKAPTYGLTEFADLFTARQLTVITLLSDLVQEVRGAVIGHGGTPEYANAVATYLGLAVSRGTDYQANVTTWHYQNEQIRNVFARQAIPMAWDFLEVNILGTGSGTWASQVELAAQALDGLVVDTPAFARQQAAQDASRQPYVLSTDPPYYDNVEYSELSDFFYVWLRRTLRAVHPDLLSTLLVPKAEELVANPYRHDGKDGAKAFFEDGFRTVFANAREVASPDFPITVYYAFKQSETDADGEASSGWETLLEGMIQAGWVITSTWPFRTETASRMLAQGKNALASSIVLSLRPRPEGATTTDRRGFIATLTAELPDALRKLQQGQVAPVDLPQAAIGPGMAVFSRYSAVLEPDGSKMTVRSALSRINEILDQVLNEQEGDFDATSRFAIAWYRQHGYGVGRFGDADNLARARNTSVDTMDRDEILTSRAGNVQLIKPENLSWNYDVLKDDHTSNWEALHHLIRVLERDGIAPAGRFLQSALARQDGAVDADLVKELAHLLFRIAEGNGWTKDALSFNALVTSWPEIFEVARSAATPAVEQGAFDFDDSEE